MTGDVRRYTPNATFYENLLLLKRSFLGGSEHRVIADHVRAIASVTTGRPITILDVGSSDCRHTKKILQSVSALDDFCLITVDPDVTSLQGTPADVTRFRHFATRFEDLKGSELSPPPDVILFSHSLYYFDQPVHVLEQAAALCGGSTRIVVSHWGQDCEVRQVAGELGDLPGGLPTSCETLAKEARHLGTLVVSPPWNGSIDFDMWRTDAYVRRAAAETLAPAASDDLDAKLMSILDRRHATGRRTNVVFSVDVQP